MAGGVQPREMSLCTTSREGCASSRERGCGHAQAAAAQGGNLSGSNTGLRCRGCQVPCCHLPLPQPRPHVLKAIFSPQIKSSHLGLPWRAQDLFRTEQKDEFTPKSRGPAEIQKANSHVSCVPLGTLKGYCPQRKVLFAP